MTERSPDDLRHELQALDQAHAQNEAARDSFVALAHTALFAASVSFVGSAVPLAKAVWPAALIAGWAIDVAGLLALTISFATARKAIDARRAALFEDTPPIALWPERLNGFALWSFPAALLCLFSFVTANVVHIHDQETKPATTTTTTTTVVAWRGEGSGASTACSPATRRWLEAPDGCDARSKGSSHPAASTSAAYKEVRMH